MTELDKNDLIPRSELRAEVERAVAAALGGYATWLPRIPKMWASLYGDEETGQKGIVGMLDQLSEKISELVRVNDRQMTEFEEVKKGQAEFADIKDMMRQILSWVKVASAFFGLALALGLLNSGVLTAIWDWFYRAYLINIVEFLIRTIR